MPFVGLATFVRQPACPDWDRLDGTDVAVLGIPIDTASSYRVGTRFAPMRPLGTLIALREGGTGRRTSELGIAGSVQCGRTVWIAVRIVVVRMQDD
jgi:arginase family enzyme